MSAPDRVVAGASGPARSGRRLEPVPPVDPTAEDVVAAAERLAGGLVERQAETEERGRYAEDTHRAFSEAGLYRILVPRRYGGLELGVQTFARVARALARGCPSTGWMYLFGHAHTLIPATLLGEAAQAEVFATGEFIAPATVAPSGTAVPGPGGSWTVSGTFPYSSGSPYATHAIGHALVDGGPDAPPTPLLFVVPREDVTVLDDWHGGLGLRGSGSHSVRIDGAVVPADRALTGHLSMLPVTDDMPGRALHGPEYGGGPLSFMLLEMGILAAGIARGALDAYEELLRTKLTSFLPFVPRGEDPDYQMHYGEAAGMIAAAEAAVTDAVRQWSETCHRGAAAFTREQELRLATIGREAFRLCWRAVEGHLFATAGSSSVRPGQRLERIWRDLSTMHTHAGVAVFLSSTANRELARAVLGPAAGAA